MMQLATRLDGMAYLERADERRPSLQKVRAVILCTDGVGKTKGGF